MSLVLGAAGCTKSSFSSIPAIKQSQTSNPGGPPPPTIPPGSCINQNDQFQQPASQTLNKIDLLYVIDTSSSLDAERSKVADGASAVLSALDPATNLRAAVLLAHGSSSSWYGKLYSKPGAPAIQDSTQLSVSQFQTELKAKFTSPPSDGATDGGEFGTGAFQGLTQGAALSTAINQGFFRSDAALAVMFISDENDLCAIESDTPGADYSGTNNPYLSVCPSNTAQTAQGVFNRVRSVVTDQTGAERPFIIGGIVYNNAQTMPVQSENGIGHGFLESIDLASAYSATSGLTIDLALTDYIPGLSNLGSLIQTKLNLLSRFTLTHSNVVPSSITVKVDGQITTATFDSTTNAVLPANLGQANSIIEINYCTL